jgi:hypothetical protein
MTAKQLTRKLRLYYCACCRLRWEAFLDEATRRTLEVIELHADGRVDRFEWRETRRSVRLAEQAAARVARYYPHNRELHASAVLAALVVAAAKVQMPLRDSFVPASTSVEPAQQVHLLQELFGNPFNPVTIEPAWRTQTVVALARAIHADRSYDLMPVLGDALQDAGCNNNTILNHCNDTKQVHVRGCWLIDKLLGKE